MGSYQLFLDGQVIATVESDKARALLAYLVLEQDRPHAREKLATIFWPEKDETHARDSLSQALSHLRNVLGDRHSNESTNSGKPAQSGMPFLIVTPKAIQFNPNKEFQTDVGEFLSLIAACKTHEHPQNMSCDDCVERYLQATYIYRGDFLDGFYLPKSLAFEEWATIWREKLHISMMEVLEYLVEAMERRRDLETALEYSQWMVQLDELSESGCLHTMRLFALLAKKKEALAEYVKFQQSLMIQLGAEPGLEAKTLYQLIKNEEAGSLSSNLPADLTPFIGREQELNTLWDMLRNPEVRLISILGTGGCGKTRLAIEAARKQRYQFVDGTHFISLSAFGKGNSLAIAITEGLGLILGSLGGPKKQLLEYLRNRQVLLILDSFEMAIEHVGLLAEMLSSSQQVKILVTSRMRLNISGEYVFPLEGMRFPPANAEELITDYSSVELFIETGRLVKPGYMPDNLGSVGEICRLLEGIPLSVVLASTWLDMLNSEEIAIEIRKSLDFLSTRLNDVPERQRSLRATFEYSWNLLDANEQCILMSLSVFHNPFTGKAASEVAEASLQQLHELMGKSLLVSRHSRFYQMHDMIRQYSQQKMSLSTEGLEIAIRQKHCDYFIQQMATWSSVFKGPQQSAQLAEADHVIDDALAAWEWAVRQVNLNQLSLASEGLMLYFFLRYRYQQGERTCKMSLESLGLAIESVELLALVGWIMAWQACFNRCLGNIDLAKQLLDKSLEKLIQAEVSGQDTRLGQALHWREKSWLTSDLVQLLDYLKRSEALYLALGESWRNAEVVAFMGEVYSRLGDRVSALENHQQAVILSQAAGEPRLVARCLTSLAYNHISFWNLKNGLHIMEQAASSYQSVGDAGSLSQAELHSGIALLVAGLYSEAETMLRSSLQKLLHLGDHFYTAYAILFLGVCHEQSGQFAQAALTVQKALDLAQKGGYQREEMQSLAHLGVLELFRGNPSRAFELLQRSVDGFRQMKFAGELAMALGGLALVQHHLGKENPSLISLSEALHLTVASHHRFSLLLMPAALVVRLADIKKWEQSMEAYSAVMTEPLVANSRLFAEFVGSSVDLAKQHLPEDIYASALVRGRALDVFEVLGRLLTEIGP